MNKIIKRLATLFFLFLLSSCSAGGVGNGGGLLGGAGLNGNPFENGAGGSATGGPSETGSGNSGSGEGNGSGNAGPQAWIPAPSLNKGNVVVAAPSAPAGEGAIAALFKANRFYSKIQVPVKTGSIPFSKREWRQFVKEAYSMVMHPKAALTISSAYAAAEAPMDAQADGGPVLPDDIDREDVREDVADGIIINSFVSNRIIPVKGQPGAVDNAQPQQQIAMTTQEQILMSGHDLCSGEHDWSKWIACSPIRDDKSFDVAYIPPIPENADQKVYMCVTDGENCVSEIVEDDSNKNLLWVDDVPNEVSSAFVLKNGFGTTIVPDGDNLAVVGTPANKFDFFDADGATHLTSAGTLMATVHPANGVTIRKVPAFAVDANGDVCAPAIGAANVPVCYDPNGQNFQQFAPVVLPNSFYTTLKVASGKISFGAGKVRIAEEALDLKITQSQERLGRIISNSTTFLTSNDLNTTKVETGAFDLDAAGVPLAAYKTTDAQGVEHKFLRIYKTDLLFGNKITEFPVNGNIVDIQIYSQNNAPNTAGKALILSDNPNQLGFATFNYLVTPATLNVKWVDLGDQKPKSLLIADGKASVVFDESNHLVTFNLVQNNLPLTTDQVLASIQDVDLKQLFPDKNFDAKAISISQKETHLLIGFKDLKSVLAIDQLPAGQPLSLNLTGEQNGANPQAVPAPIALAPVKASAPVDCASLLKQLIQPMDVAHYIALKAQYTAVGCK